MKAEIPLDCTEITIHCDNDCDITMYCDGESYDFPYERTNEQLEKCKKLTKLSLTSDLNEDDDIGAHIYVHVPSNVTNLTTNIDLEWIDIHWDNVEDLTIEADCIYSLVNLRPNVAKSITITPDRKGVDVDFFMRFCDEYYFLDIVIEENVIDLSTIGTDLVERFNITNKEDFGDIYLEYVRGGPMVKSAAKLN